MCMLKRTTFVISPQLGNNIHGQCMHYVAYFSFQTLQRINEFRVDSFSCQCTLRYCGVGLHLFAFYMNYTENDEKSTIKQRAYTS